MSRFVIVALLLGLLGVEFALDATGVAAGREAWISGALFALGALITVIGMWTKSVENGRSDADRERLEERLRLSQRLEAVGRLTGGIAHEFNNWLTTILGYADLLANRLGDEHPLTREVSEIRRAGRRAASLVDQLMAFSRRQVIAPRVLDLNRLVADTTELLQRLIGEDVELDCRLDADALRVEADPSQLEQLLVHLAVHARDAMPAGGRLEIRTAAGRLESSRPGDLFEVVPGEYCRLVVTDTGGGIDADTLGHLFEPFYTNRDGGLGGGLGLASVYGIVKQNRGYIWVDSEEGEGTVFSVYLPRTHQAPAEDGKAADRTRAAPAEVGCEDVPRVLGEPEPILGTILLVEDEDMVRCLIREVLSEHGYRILEASGAQQALDQLAAHPEPIELMLTDVIMPGMPGNALARRLAVERPEVRVLYISGYTESHLTQRGVLPPGERLLQKPFTADELVAAVESAIGAGAGADADAESLMATGT